jgi:molybdopterin synthase sulfur carrier subunit
MATYQVIAFGITKDILGGREKKIEVKGNSVKDLRGTLLVLYPSLKDLNSLMIAVNNTYAEDDVTLNEDDEIALIPPVSGG